MNKQRFAILALLISLAIVSVLNIIHISAASPLAPKVDQVKGASVSAEQSNNAPTQLVGFGAANYSVDEVEGTATITVTLDAALSVTVTVGYATSDDTAIAGSDYLTVSGVLMFTPGVTSQTFAVSILDDTLEELDETIALTLSNPTNSTLRIPDESAILTILDDDNYIYLSLVLNRWPPIPYTPVLNSIPDPDGNGNYTVSWDSTELAESYTLEEATNANFTDAIVSYQGTGTLHTVTGQPAGTYYYRVKATNGWGDSRWSNVQSVRVGPPETPVLNPISNPGGYGSYTVSWDEADMAQTYILQEDDNAAFSNPITVYSGLDTSKSITGRDNRTYYYRVQASNSFGSSPWSNVVSVQVAQTCLPQLGGWTGEESQRGYSVSFTITSECKVHNFKIKIPFGGLNTCRITILEDLTIVDNEFSFDFLGGDISGEFDSSTSASGAYRVVLCGNTIIIPASEGTWEADK